jgi:iron complex transport system substrate-binding protein
MTSRPRVARAITAVLAAALAVGCSQDDGSNEEHGSSEESGERSGVTVENQDRPLTIETTPDRIFTISAPNTELLLELGLEDKIVGMAQGVTEVDILAKFEDTYDALNNVEVDHVVDGHNYPSWEAIVETDPDFIYGTPFTIGESGSIVALERIDELGIIGFISQPREILNATLDDLYDEITILGQIFGIEDEAAELIDQMMADVDEVQSTLGPVDDPPPVFVFDLEGEGGIFTAGQAMLSHLIQLAGGRNIFDDVEQAWFTSNNEDIIDRAPEHVIVVDYGDESPEDKISSFKENPLFQEVPAVQNDSFIVFGLNDVLPGIRSADTVARLAQAIHPDRF